MVRLQGEPHLLFLYDITFAIGAPAAAAHFGRVCAGSITQGAQTGRCCANCARDDRAVLSRAKSAQIQQRFLNAN
jgi:hypothetical protein